MFVKLYCVHYAKQYIISYGDLPSISGSSRGAHGGKYSLFLIHFGSTQCYISGISCTEDLEPLIDQRQNGCYNCTDCYDNQRCACNRRVSLGVYCCIWWWLFAAVGLVVVLGAVSTLMVTLNQVSTEVAVIEKCEILLLVYGVLSVLSGLTFFVSLCICNCKCTFRHRPQLIVVIVISLVVYIAGLVCVNYKICSCSIWECKCSRW